MDLYKFFKNRKYEMDYYLDKRKINGQNLVQVTQKVFNDYCDNVKLEEYDTYDLVQRKLTRNVLLAYQSTYNPDLFLYVNLSIFLNHEHSRIIRVANRKGKFDYIVDLKYKAFLNQKLGINALENEIKGKVS